MFDTKKYATMFSRDKHTNIHLHKIITLLRDTKNTYTLKQIGKITGTPINTDQKLLNAVKQNDKIIFENDSCRFKHEFSYRNKEEFLDTLKKGSYQYGIELSKLLDCPIDLMEIINECSNENSIIIFKSVDNQKLVFYNTLPVKTASNTTKELFQTVKITSYSEILKELEIIGLSKQINKKKIPIEIKDNKKKRQKRRIRITNTHITGLDLEDI